MTGIPEVIKSETIFEGAVFSVDRDRLRTEEKESVVRDVVRHNGGAGGVVLVEDDKVILVRQYRHPAGDYLLEIPAGKLDAGELPETCAAREIREETGFLPGDLILLSDFYTTPGFCSEQLWIYMTVNPEAGEQSLDQDEEVDLVKVPLQEALRMIADGRIRDSKTIIGLLLARDWLAARRDSGTAQ